MEVSWNSRDGCAKRQGREGGRDLPTAVAEDTLKSWHPIMMGVTIDPLIPSSRCLCSVHSCVPVQPPENLGTTAVDVGGLVTN